MQILCQHVVPIIKLLTDAGVTVRQRGQTLPGWVNGAVKHEEPLTTSGWWGQSEGSVRQVKHTASMILNQRMVNRILGWQTGCCDDNRGWGVGLKR